MYLLLLTLFFQSLVISEAKAPKDFIWENRVLIIQSSQPDSSWFEEDLKKALAERKLVVFLFSQGRLIGSTYEGKIDTPEFLKKLKNLPQNSHQWVLIGLDGGIKKSGTNFPQQLEIFRTIDAMPMRQSEIRKKGN